MRIAVCLLTSAVMASCASPGPDLKPVDAAALIGIWKVDLRPKPNDPAYFQEFVVTSVNGKTFTGTFYGAPIEQARINTDWGTIRIAFVTADQSGPYNHSANLIGNRLEGLTNSTGRDFLSYWSAAKP
jgi:hypothetical protein